MFADLTHAHLPLNHLSMHLIVIIQNQLCSWCFILSINKHIICNRYDSLTSESGLRGVNKPQKVRIAIRLAAGCIIALHLPWEKRELNNSFLWNNIINNRPYFYVYLLLKHTLKILGDFSWTREWVSDMQTKMSIIFDLWIPLFHGTNYLCKVRDICTVLTLTTSITGRTNPMVTKASQSK
jgi:hypothetical protein